MTAMTAESGDGRRWVDFQHRGVAVTLGALPVFLADRWRLRGNGLRGLRSFAGGLRPASRALPSTPIPEHVFQLWAAQGRPECWITYRPNGLSCLIIIPSERVIRVPRADCALIQAQFVAAAATQSLFRELAPEVLKVGDGGTHIEEAHLSLSRGCIRDGEIEAAVRRMHVIVPHRMAQVSAVVSAMLVGLDLPRGLQEFATDLCARYGESRVPMGQVHGDLMPHNLWRRRDGRLVALDWEFSREAPASYDLWHLHFMPWIEGEISLAEWMALFSGQLDRCLPDQASQAGLNRRLNALSTAAFLLRTGYNGFVPTKLDATLQLLADKEHYAETGV